MTGVSGWRLGHKPALDGLRGVAVLLVVAEHGGYLPGPAGSFGVTVFFVLSGFLISRVILEARDAGTWSMRTFLWRRAVRLLPALTLVTTVMLAVWVALGRSLTEGLGHYATTLLYMENWTRGAAPDSFMAHSWSLAVEEQFYLLWPLLLPWFVTNRTRTVLLAILTATLWLLRTQPAMIVLFGPVAYTSTLTNAYALMLGALLAVVAPTIRAAPRWVAPAGLVALGVLLWASYEDPSAPTTWAPFAALAAVALVWSAATVRRSSFLAWQPLRGCGRISYALYLWHWPLLIYTGTYATGGVSAGVVLAVSFGSAVLSTLLLEEPLRARFAGRVVRVVRRSSVAHEATDSYGPPHRTPTSRHGGTDATPAR